MLLYWFDLFGTAVFACSGALIAGQRRMDIFGVVVIAFITAVGGGTVRDLILGMTPVFWIRDATYVWVIVLAALLTFLVAHRLSLRSQWLVVADALGLAVFTIIGTRVGMEAVGPGVIATMTGIMSGVLGGILRDVLVNRLPLIFCREIYALAALSGAVVLQLLEGFYPAPVIAGGVVLLLRLAAIRWNLHLPRFPERP